MTDTERDAVEANRTPHADLLTAPEPTAPAEAPEEEPANGNAAPSVRDRLRAAYREAVGGRREIMPIVPGVYEGLAAEYQPIDDDLRRKLQRRAARLNDTSEEASRNFRATLLADSCVQILMRPEPGAEYRPLCELAFGDRDPVRYDRRLAEVLGIDLPAEATQAQVARLAFVEDGLFEAHYQLFAAWSTGDIPGDEDEDDGGGVRPT